MEARSSTAPASGPFASFPSMSAILHNPILNTDSYKASHYLQYPPNTSAMFSYIESRGGRYPNTVFFGLQMLLKEYLCRPFTFEMIEQAEAFYAAHGEPFNADGWRYILNRYQGYLPIRIRAVPEGSVVPTHNVLATVECDDPQVFWLTSWLETMLLRIWYPITVATQSWHLRQIIRDALLVSSDDVSQLPFKLHDFGARGVSSAESAAIGGAAHLVSFKGSDTVLGVMAANLYYHDTMAAFSVPAAEHSTVTSWGQAHESDAFRNMLRQFGKPGAIVSVVSDSYDLFAALRLWGSELKQAVIDSGAMLVVRPDSGNPQDIVMRSIASLDSDFGSTLNGKGRKVLNHVRILQGDGVNPASIKRILTALDQAGFAADNIVFGIGGALLQQVNRDTQRFAMKCSAVRVDGQWRDVWKDPVTDSGKRSMRGRITLLHHADSGAYRTVRLDDADRQNDTGQHEGWTDAMTTVFEHGKLCVDDTLQSIRERAHRHESTPD